MYKFALIGNGPLTNRGCEAIVLGTKRILETEFSPAEFLLASFARDSKESLPSNFLPIELPYQRPRWSSAWWKYRANKLLGRSDDLSDALRPLKDKLHDVTAAFSIGGDGYAIDFGHQIVDRLIIIDDYTRSLGIPVIIWGASIGPFDKEPEFELQMAEHLRTIDLIVVREYHSKEYLARLGLTKNVCFAPDPAFVIAATPCDLPANVQDILQTGCVGLNLSPLLATYATDGDIGCWIQQASGLVEQILAVSKKPVLLIYHVTTADRTQTKHMDDLLFLQAVLENLPSKSRERVALVPEALNSQSLKWIISRTSLFIGARAHSTLAALSSKVPCISIAYSMKARGINDLVFGHTDWVVSSRELTAEVIGNKLEEAFLRYKETKSQLDRAIPMLVQAAFQAGARVHDVVQNSH